MSILPEQFIFTQSNLQSFVNCPYQFYLRYIQHFQWPAAETMDMLQYEADRMAGSRFHQLVHQSFLGVPLNKLSQMANNDPDSRVSVWFEAFTTTFHEKLPGALFPEHTFGAFLGKHELTAKYDLLQYHGNRFTIYDWKTSRKRPAKAWLAGQLQSLVFPLVLALHLEELGEHFSEIRMVYWEANEPQNPFIFSSTPDTLIRDKATILSLMQQIASLNLAEFCKTQDLQPCRFCRYRSYCNRGVLPAHYDDFIEAQYLEISTEPEETSFGEEIS